jgi:adenine-specific DNA-methyltransferase
MLISLKEFKMNYIGSKKSLLTFIEKAVDKCGIEKQDVVLCDIFSGTGRVGRHFKDKGYSIIANDMEDYSYSLINHYIGNHKNLKIERHIKNLNKLQGIDTGFIFNNYCPSGKYSLVEKVTKEETTSLTRKYYSDQNGMIIDEARQVIDSWLKTKRITKKQYNYLLAIIIEASDKVANTASVYGAFLKELKKTALKKIDFKDIEYSLSEKSHKVYKSDANLLIKKVKGDILYLDPPYNERQYGANYHVLNTIAKYDSPELRGVTGMRDYTPSMWCRKNKVEEVFEDLVKKAKFDYILFSYSSESLMSQESIESIMSKYGEYSFIEKKYSRFKADKNSEERNYKSDFVIEYIHILRKR